MALDRFELLELRRDDGVQTFYAREIATARPVQVHLFANGSVEDNLALLALVQRLPETERRRVIDRGVSAGRPYLVTERLAGFASLREWLGAKATAASIDDQFFDLIGASRPDPTLETSGEPHSAVGTTAAKSLLATALGVAAALVFLALLIGVIVFHPR